MAWSETAECEAGHGWSESPPDPAAPCPPPEAWATALATLPGMGPARLVALLAVRRPREAWADVAAGVSLTPAMASTMGPDARALAARWQVAANALDVRALWDRHVEAGIGVCLSGGAAFPAALANDVAPPAVLFHLGEPDVLGGPRVAVVGTRSCTRYGLDVARELGRHLAEAGVGVVSGLAIGIDGAAHAGALDADHVAPPIAVVGSGLDVIYPRRHAVLWRRVCQRGVILSEAPLGAAPERWRFPARNRLIAALSDVVVVVESPEVGGSMHTVAEALRRDRPVLAVPGPVRSAASAGTNKLLAEGAAPARDATDVLVALGLSPGRLRATRDARSAPAGEDAAVLEAFGWQPATLDRLTARTGRPLAEVALALARLEEQGWVVGTGSWYERVARSEP